MEDFSLKDRIFSFKDDMLKSKRYWILSLILILMAFFATMTMSNYKAPRFEIGALIFSCIASIFLITFYHSHRDEKNFYKTAFLVILLFGIVFSFLTPIMCNDYEFENFIRSEMTSNGVINPEFHSEPFTLETIDYDGYYLTVQTAYDLAKDGKNASSYIDDYIYFTVNDTNKHSVSDYIDMDLKDSSIFKTDADTQPINTTLVKFHSAFAQNPFFAYIASAMGMAIAKLLSLNAIWILWLGRIFNATLYAVLAGYAIKKTPILKVPLFVIACIPAAISQASSISVDPLVNGLVILAIAYFLMFYKSPKNSLDHKDILKFSLLVVLIGLCKIPYCALIFLLVFIPQDNFKQRKYYYSIGLIVLMLIGIMALWYTFYVSPGIHNSWRYSLYLSQVKVGAQNQINYMMGHSTKTLASIGNLFSNLDTILKLESGYGTKFISLYLLFSGVIYLLYPVEKIRHKTKIGAFIVFCMVYFGSYIFYILTWSKVGRLNAYVPPSYFFPLLGLIPIFLGINHVQKDTTEIDYYIVMLAITFIIFRLLTLALLVY